MTQHPEPSFAASSDRASLRSRGQRGAAIGALLLLTLLAYANTFGVPFVFDDIPAVVENTSIRDLSALGTVLSPQEQGGLTVSGRPLVNLSLAVNHALTGQQVWSYHAFNLLVHLAAGLVLYDFVRRTIARLPWRRDADIVGFLSAALWLLHPLQTESVTYVVQRAESMAALCYLITLNGFVWMIERRSTRWGAVSIAACFAGMASKEVMVSAPLMVLLYDRTFVSGTFAAAVRRWRYYLMLASSWLLLGWLVVGTSNRGGTAGFGTDIGVGDYLVTQCYAVVRYLGLVFWPHPLVFDYGIWTADGLGAVWIQLLVLSGLLIATMWALRSRPVCGFVGAWFFALLAPSSSFVPIASQTIAEHRCYLAIASVITAAVAILIIRLRRVGWWLGFALACLAGIATFVRSRDYRTESVLWASAVRARPENPRAHNNLGHALFKEGRLDEALVRYREAIRLEPKYPEPHYNLGLALVRLGQPDAGIQAYREALRLRPDYPEAHNNLGTALLAQGREEEAAAHYTKAIELKPDFAEPYSNLGNVLNAQGRLEEALLRYEQAVARKPEYAEAHYNWGNGLAALGRMREAVGHYERALRIRPDYLAACSNLGNAWLELGQLDEAVSRYEQALRIDPSFAPARQNLASVLEQLGREAEALVHYEQLPAGLPGLAQHIEQLRQSVGAQGTAR